MNLDPDNDNTADSGDLGYALCCGILITLAIGSAILMAYLTEHALELLYRITYGS